MDVTHTSNRLVRHLADSRRRSTGTDERCDNEKRAPTGQPQAVIETLHHHDLRLSTLVTSLPATRKRWNLRCRPLMRERAGSPISPLSSSRKTHVGYYPGVCYTWV